MKLKVINTLGQDSGVIEVKDNFFACKYNEPLIHQVVTAFLANARTGNRAQKTRSEVAKSTRKPWKQKGTGRARVGMASSPLWRGGGRIFPNTPDENFSQKINRKMYRLAIASIISKLVKDERLIVVDSISVDVPKTKSFVQLLKNMALDTTSVVMIISELTEDIFLASRNLPRVLILEPHQIDPYTLLRADKVLFARSALEELQGQYA